MLNPTKLHSFPKPVARRYQLDRQPLKTGSSVALSQHGQSTTKASPKLLISHPQFCISHQFGVKKTEGRYFTPWYGLGKKATSAIYWSHQDFNSFLSSFSLPLPVDHGYKTAGEKLQIIFQIPPSYASPLVF